MGAASLRGRFVVMCLMGLVCSSQAYQFFVGGREGWVVSPSENYHHWAERNRFQVKDTLHFKYQQGSDSVLMVTKEDYFSCNTKNPLHSFTEGDSVFIFDHSGPFYFISGNPDNCNKGQKLFIIVMAVRNHGVHHKHASPSPSPSTAPAFFPPPPTVSPPVESPMSGAEMSDPDAPALAPVQKSGSTGLIGCVGLVLGVSVGMSVVLGGFVGMI